jgi:hypothetical protein
MSTFGPDLKVFQQVANGDMDALRDFIDARNQEIQQSWHDQLSRSADIRPAETHKPADDFAPQKPLGE